MTASELVAAAHRSPVLAALLSFLVPGLGQAWAGRLRRGALLAFPFVAGVAVALALLAGSSVRTLGLLLQPGVIVTLIALDLVLLAYRAAVVVDAYRIVRRAAAAPTPAGGHLARYYASLAALALLLAAVAAPHGYLAFVGYRTYDLVVTVFQPGDETGQAEPTATPPPPPTPPPTVRPSTSPTPAPTPSPTPAPTPRPPEPVPAWAQDGRLHLLVVGGDAGPGRWGLRTDTMILVSVDVATGRAAMFGIPRNLRNVPLPRETAKAFACRCFPEMLNALHTYAMGRPAQFPGGDERGIRALSGAVEALTGVTLDGTVVADLNGFVRLVDALGGLEIDVPEPVFDARYPREDGYSYIRLWIPVGRQQMDGSRALAYARSRHGSSDYNRMERQQIVLLALRRQMDVATILTRLPELAEIAKESLWTDLDVRDLPDLLDLAARVDPDSVYLTGFNPPRYPEFLTARDWARIRAEVREALPWPPPGRHGSYPA